MASKRPSKQFWAERRPRHALRSFLAEQVIPGSDQIAEEPGGVRIVGIGIGMKALRQIPVGPVHVLDARVGRQMQDTMGPGWPALLELGLKAADFLEVGHLAFGGFGQFGRKARTALLVGLQEPAQYLDVGILRPRSWIGRGLGDQPLDKGRPVATIGFGNRFQLHDGFRGQPESDHLGFFAGGRLGWGLAAPEPASRHVKESV